MTQQPAKRPRGAGMQVQAEGLFDALEKRCPFCETMKPAADFQGGTAFKSSTMCKACRQLMRLGQWYPKAKRAIAAARPRSPAEVWLALVELAEAEILEGRDPRAAAIAKAQRATREAVGAALDAVPAAVPATAPAKPRLVEDPRKTALRGLLKRYVEARLSKGEARDTAASRFWRSTKAHGGASANDKLADITDADVLDRMIVKAQSLVFEVGG